MTDKSGVHLSTRKLHADQLIIEVMRVMYTWGQDKVPVYKDDILLGTVSSSEILKFLNNEDEKNLYYHKLNYTMESLLMLKNKHR
jgi:predicted transcriptional regulator